MHLSNLWKVLHWILLASVSFSNLTLFGQGRNNLWMGGYQSWAGPPNGGMDINFLLGAPVISSMNRAINFRRTTANITDISGNSLFSTNGAFLGDVDGDTLLNGTGINPSTYTTDYTDIGLFLTQSQLILPKPLSTDLYYLIHDTRDDGPTSSAHRLYLSTIDMALNGGLGAVVSKNVIIIEDLLNTGKITAVRHANGRDWWVICHKVNTSQFYRLLATPNGVSVVGTQDIGIVRPSDAGQVCFSPNGNKFAYYWAVEDLEIFDFDRCTGLFSNPVFIPIEDDNANSGVAFSPNSRYLYVSSSSDAYQFDTEAGDIGASMVHIAHWDGFYSPSPPFATGFDLAQLAPDGKVYMSTGNSTFHLHVVNDPDEGGLACNMVQHGVELPRWYSNSLPNHPNYHLGPVLGSVCDSLGMGVSELHAPLAAASASPNPSTGRVSLSYGAQREAGELQVLGAQGRVVLREKLPAWSTVHALDLLGEPAGMYYCRLQWGVRATSVRVIVQP